LKKFLYINFELIAWTAGLIFLFILPIQDDHFSLCLFKAAGINFCPGCGIGSSISHLLHLKFEESFTIYHLDFLAFLIIMHRIISLLKNNGVYFYNSAEVKTGV